jgi:methionyl-tRNA formyltransferase
MRFKTIFMGTPAAAVAPLRALFSAGHQITCVYTRAPRPAGRGQQPRLSPVHEFAATKGMIVRTPPTLNDVRAIADFRALGSDLAVVVGYGLLLPKEILRAPRLGCINLHFSLLPRHRGAAPIERALQEGDTETGVTIMQMDEGLDTGPILLARAVAIGPRTTAAQLHEKLANVGASLLLQAMQGLATGQLKPEPQALTGVTYAAKLKTHEGQIDWRKSNVELDCLVRALNPAPGVWFAHRGEKIKVLEAETAPGPDIAGGAPGDVLDDQMTVACGQGALKVLRLQRPGKTPLPAAEFLRGYAIARGARLESEAASEPAIAPATPPR